ncbi:MAG TPA: VOC family protein [Vicinamibacterales bacterium]|nr:VOC family protein [Vicinamibacterales bacterium]
MARALGVGGVFFRSRDPKALGAWYQRWLGVEFDGQAVSFSPAAMPPAALTVWCPFAADTKYFDPAKRDFMINLVVDDLDAALAQVKDGGAEIVGAVQEADYGRFGWFIDPDGNKIELWQPK